MLGSKVFAVYQQLMQDGHPVRLELLFDGQHEKFCLSNNQPVQCGAAFANHTHGLSSGAEDQPADCPYMTFSSVMPPRDKEMPTESKGLFTASRVYYIDNKLQRPISSNVDQCYMLPIETKAMLELTDRSKDTPTRAEQVDERETIKPTSNVYLNDEEKTDNEFVNENVENMLLNETSDDIIDRIISHTNKSKQCDMTVNQKSENDVHLVNTEIVQEISGRNISANVKPEHQLDNALKLDTKYDPTNENLESAKTLDNQLVNAEHIILTSQVDKTVLKKVDESEKKSMENDFVISESCKSTNDQNSGKDHKKSSEANFTLSASPNDPKFLGKDKNEDNKSSKIISTSKTDQTFLEKAKETDKNSSETNFIISPFPNDPSFAEKDDDKKSSKSNFIISSSCKSTNVVESDFRVAEDRRTLNSVQSKSTSVEREEKRMQADQPDLVLQTKFDTINIFSAEVNSIPLIDDEAGLAHMNQINGKPTDTKMEEHFYENTNVSKIKEDMDKQGVKTTQKGVCGACKKPIVGQVITALGYTWHPEHFTCAHCNQELGTSNFFERDGQPFCEQDYHHLFSPRCGYCSGPILDKCISAVGNTWHPEHFLCAGCGRQLGDEGFHERGESAYCKTCYFDQFAPKCGGCNTPITEKYISSLNQQWHTNCFVCKECSSPFHDGAFFEHEGHPYCETHFLALRGSLCAGCHKGISGRCITAMFRKFHPEHFVCSFCLKQLNKGTFKEQGDKPYCHECFDRLFG